MTTTFHNANQARLSLKMILSIYSWFNGSTVETDKNGYNVVIYTTRLDSEVKKIVPTIYNGVAIKIGTDLRKNRK